LAACLAGFRTSFFTQASGSFKASLPPGPMIDEGAYHLVDAFYEALENPQVSKAQALQAFSSPFLIINN
jgi:hypothetical protein